MAFDRLVAEFTHPPFFLGNEKCAFGINVVDNYIF